MPHTFLKCLELNNNMNLRAFIQKLHGAKEDQPGGQLPLVTITGDIYQGDVLLTLTLSQVTDDIGYGFQLQNGHH